MSKQLLAEYPLPFAFTTPPGEINLLVRVQDDGVITVMSKNLVTPHHLKDVRFYIEEFEWEGKTRRILKMEGSKP